MDIRPLHSWDVTWPEATALQKQLAARVDTAQPLGRCDLVAGADVSYDRFSPVLYAAVVVLKLPGLEVVETRGVRAMAGFPYRTGYLSFREAPPLVEAFARLDHDPDAVVLDGQGLAHPRRFGLACHLGLWLDRPCVGCAKSRLTGRFEEPAAEAGSWTDLKVGDEVVGAVVRTKARVKPLFVSPGHRIDLAGSIDLVLRCCRGYRLPEPTRQAHLLVNALRRGEVEPS